MKRQTEQWRRKSHQRVLSLRYQCRKHPHRNWLMEYVVDSRSCQSCSSHRIWKMHVSFIQSNSAFYMGKCTQFYYSRFSNEIIFHFDFPSHHSLNTFRLWTVQLFAIIKEYETEFSLDGSEIDSNLCEMIEYKVGKSSNLIHNNTENVDVLCEAVSRSYEKSFHHFKFNFMNV